RAVRGHNGPTPDPGRIEEHLASAILTQKFRGGERRVHALGARRDRARRGGHLVDRRRCLHRYEYVQALRPAGLDRTRQAGLGPALADYLGGSDGHWERVGGWWVEVEHEVCRTVPAIHLDQRRVVLHGTLIGEPQQRAAVVAQRVRDLALRSLCPQLDGPHPGWCVTRDVLLHERRLAAQHPDNRERPVPQRRDDPVVNGFQ